MTVFYDDFERANGVPANGWVVRSGTFAISNGSIAGSSGVGVQEGEGTGGYIEAAIHHYLPSAGGSGTGLLIHAGTTTAGALWVGVLLVANVWVFRVVNGYGGTGNLVASVDLPGYPGPYVKVKASWEGGHYKAWLNDSLLLEGDTEYAANSIYAGICAYGTTTSVTTDFRLVTDAAIDLVVTPNPTGNYGSPVEMSAVGTGTAWTAGTPGAPVLGVTVGVISDQVVADATHMTFTWTIGNFLGVATFTDPSTGETDAVLVTSNPAIVDPSGAIFSPEAIAYIERSAIAEESPTIANREMVVSESGPSITLSSGINQIRLSVWDKTAELGGDPGINALGDFLWKLLTNRNVQTDYAWNPSRDTSLKEDLEYLVNEFFFVRTVNEYTLGDVITTLAGEGGPTHKDIMDAVGELAAPDLQPVLDAIAALRGDQVATVAAVLTQLDTIRSIGDYTLSTVKTWVDAVRGTDQPTVHDVLDAIAALNNAPTTDLEPVLTSVAGVNTNTLDLIATLAAFLIPEVATVQTILDAIEAVSPEPTASGNAPIWPGIENVELGTPVALVTGTTIEGPMDGILVDITSAPANAGLYLFGATKSYTHAGSVMFQTDNGDFEFPAKIAVAKHVLCPRTMKSAGHAILRINAGFGGTATPWTTVL